jgi:hypothetical protein
VTHAGEGQVHAGDAQALARHAIKDATPGDDRFGLIGVEGDRQLRPAQLQDAGMHDVAPDQQRLAAVGNEVAGLARCVARKGDRFDAGRHLAVRRAQPRSRPAAA